MPRPSLFTLNESWLYFFSVHIKLQMLKSFSLELDKKWFFEQQKKDIFDLKGNWK